MEGCRRKHGKKGWRCYKTEADRLVMSLRQPQSMVNYTSTGFKKIKAPKAVFDLLINHWERNSRNNATIVVCATHDTSRYSLEVGSRADPTVDSTPSHAACSFDMRGFNMHGMLSSALQQCSQKSNLTYFHTHSTSTNTDDEALSRLHVPVSLWPCCSGSTAIGI